MAWIDYKKAIHMVPKGWILDCLKMYVVSGKVIKFFTETIKKLRVELIGEVFSNETRFHYDYL